MKILKSLIFGLITKVKSSDDIVIKLNINGNYSIINELEESFNLKYIETVLDNYLHFEKNKNRFRRSDLYSDLDNHNHISWFQFQEPKLRTKRDNIDPPDDPIVNLYQGIFKIIFN